MERRALKHDRACWIAELYLKFPEAAQEPPLQLKGFEKVRLLPGQSATVRFDLDDRSVSTWTVAAHAWAAASGKFGVMVGSSSADIRLRGTVRIGANL